MNKTKKVIFVDENLETLFEELKEGKYEDKELHRFIKKAIDNLKEDPERGVKIPRKLWPIIYIQKYNINNLWKYDLPKGWRLIYTIKTEELMILGIILEWFDHKEYERRFNY